MYRRLSCTFEIYENEYKARTILITTTITNADFKGCFIPNDVWEKAKTVCYFLESAAEIISTIGPFNLVCNTL